VDVAADAPIDARVFDRSAGGWDERVRPDAPEHLAALAAAVARLQAPPARALDLGTGTGAAALWLARTFPDARVTGWTSRRR
jgi:predicted O-methyltransferase YrrM